MTAAGKAKGSRHEREVADYLQTRGIRAKRLPRAGARDIGDVAFPLREGTIVVEAKNRRDMKISTYVDEAQVEAVNYEVKYPAEAPAFAAAVIKRRMKPVSEAYVVMTLEEYADLLLHLKGV